jgi:hypothetical protein
LSLGWRGQVAEALARKGNNHFPRGRVSVVNVVDVAIMVVPVMRTQRMLAGLVLPRLRGRVGAARRPRFQAIDGLLTPNSPGSHDRDGAAVAPSPWRKAC